jgi:hypothetical protein
VGVGEDKLVGAQEEEGFMQRDSGNNWERWQVLWK